MKIQTKSWLLVLVAAASLCDSAQAMVGVSVVGAGMLSKPKLKSGTPLAELTTSSKLGLGGGALLDLSVGSKLAVEFGAIYAKSKFSFTSGTNQYVYSINTITAPVTLWIKAVPFLSVGLGAFYQNAENKAEIETTTAAGVKTTATSNTGYSSSNYGAQAGLRFMFPMGAMTSLVVDGLYHYGLKDLDPTAGEYKTRDILALVGLRFGI